MWFSDRDWVNLFHASSRSIKGLCCFIINKHSLPHKKSFLQFNLSYCVGNNTIEVNSQVNAVVKRIDVTIVNILLQSSQCEPISEASLVFRLFVSLQLLLYVPSFVSETSIVSLITFRIYLCKQSSFPTIQCTGGKIQFKLSWL